MLFCAGCDGIYSYTYQGTLFQSDGTTPAANVLVRCAREAQFHPDWQSTGKTDSSGHFSGSFNVLTAWAFAIRPPAPKLDTVYLLAPAMRPIEIRVREIEQPTTSTGRHLILPPVRYSPLLSEAK
jgi:hypothetical protein